MPGVITVPYLAKLRMGNACFLYAFAKGYAEAMGAELQCPDWFGRKIFKNANEPPITHDFRWTELDSLSKQPIGYFFGTVNVSLRVFAQHQLYLDYYTREKARYWFELKPEFERYAPVTASRLGYSACHVRRGDYQDTYHSQFYCTVSDESYEQAIETFDIPEPILRVQEGARQAPPELEVQGLGFLPDFLLLRDATHLLRANSSFSWFASVLGHGTTYAPIVEDRVGLQDCEFVCGNWPNTAGRFKNQSDLHLKEQ